ncbi:41087_t:CDS:2, partial [Gigaspora margarita]
SSFKVPNSDDFKEQKMRIEKDDIRTDRDMELFAIEDMPHPDPLISASSKTTNKKLEAMKDILMTYHFYNKDLGYVQGMSDLLAPLLNRWRPNILGVRRRQLLTLEHLIKFMDPLLYKHLIRLGACKIHMGSPMVRLSMHKFSFIRWRGYFGQVSNGYHRIFETIRQNFKAETLFHQFQRRVEIIDRKRSSVHQDNQIWVDLCEEGSTDEGSSSDAAVVSDRLPVIANC